MNSLQTPDLVCGESYLLRTATAQTLTFACTRSNIDGSMSAGTLTWSRGNITTAEENAVLVADARPDAVAKLCVSLLLRDEDRRIVSIEPVEPPARAGPSTEARLLVKVREIMREHLGDIGAGADMLADLDSALTRRPIPPREPDARELTPAQRLRTTLDKNAKLVEELPPWARANMSDGTAARYAQLLLQEKLSTVNRVDDHVLTQAQLDTYRTHTKVAGGAFTRGEVERLLDHIATVERSVTSDWPAFADLRTQLARVLGCDPRASLRGIVDELSSRPTPAVAFPLRPAERPGLRFPPDVDLSAVTQAQFDTAYAEAYGHLSEPYEPGVLLVDAPSRAYCCAPGCEEPASVRIFDTRAEYDCAETNACNGHAYSLGLAEKWSTWENIPLDDHVFVWNVTSFEGPNATSIEFDPDGPWIELEQTIEDGDTGPAFVCVHPTPVFAALVRAYGREGVARWAHTVDIKDTPELTPADAEDTPKITADELHFWKHCEDAKREVESWPQWKRDAAAKWSA